MTIKNLILIGSSAGGPKALNDLLKDMPTLNASIVIIQHMPDYISQSMANNINNLGAMPCTLLQDKTPLKQSSIQLVPGDIHVKINRKQTAEFYDGKLVNYVKPAIDVTMMSISANHFKNICGIILTGMGNDGAAGISHLKQLGAITIAQSKESCSVFGMPKRAIETGHIDHVLSIEQIQQKLIQLFG